MSSFTLSEDIVRISLSTNVWLVTL